MLDLRYNYNLIIIVTYKANQIIKNNLFFLNYEIIWCLILYLFKVIVSLLEESPPSRVRAALSRDGVEVYGDFVNLQPRETRSILLQVKFWVSVSTVKYMEKFGKHIFNHLLFNFHSSASFLRKSQPIWFLSYCAILEMLVMVTTAALSGVYHLNLNVHRWNFINIVSESYV